MRPVSRGDRGKEVVDIQTRLRALGYSLGAEGADGHFGPKTELVAREFQQRRLIESDGVVGENTWSELVEAGYSEGDRLLYLRLPHMRGDDVLSIQRRLNELGFDSGPENGIFGPAVELALIELQRNAGLPLDGIVGEVTLAQLRRLRKLEPAEQTEKIPDRMNGYVGVESLRGLRVTLDPAHGGHETGGRGLNQLLEKDVNLRVVLALASLLEDEGAEVLKVRSTDKALSLFERAEIVGAWAPDIHIAIHHGYCRSPLAQGAAAFYFANGAYFSESGKRLAGYVVRELVERLGRVDLHPHGQKYACLREADGLSLMVEPAYMTHPGDAAALADSGGCIAEAEAILAGLSSYLQRR